MTYAVTVRRLAEADIRQAETWYDEQRPGLGSDFTGAVEGLFTRLAESPLIYPRVHQQVRRAVLRRFPYLVYFIIRGEKVVVLACLPSSRDPQLHRSRMR